MWIRAREMALNDPVWSFVFEYGRQVTSVETSRASGYECGKRPCPHQRMYLRHVFYAKMVRQVHDITVS